MKVGICEDDRTQKEYLKQEVMVYYQQKNQKVSIETFESAEELLFQYPKDLPFSCLILDIKLKKMDGMALAFMIRKRDKEVPIIFITGDRDYVFEGYKVGAVRYILKPYQKEDLIEALEHMPAGEQKNLQEEYFCLNYMGEFLKLKKSEIIYIMVEGHYISIKTKDREYYYKESMKRIKDSLSSDCFVMANRSVLVNLQNIEKITKSECILSNGIKIALSRGCSKIVNEAFIAFYKNGK